MTPASRKHALAYVARASSSEKKNLFALAEMFPDRPVEAFRRYIEDVIEDRLVLSGKCLALAKRLFAENTDEHTFRAVIGRAYYSIHHGIRIMILRWHEYDCLFCNGLAAQVQPA